MKLKLLFIILVSLFVLRISAGERHYTVVISLDGCRWDYPQWYHTPFLDFMAQQGVESGLIPSYPSKTFPNHYTLVTGLYPEHHGLVANSFLDRPSGDHFSLSSKKFKHDPRFYGGEPIWLTAQRQGLHTAVFYWPGSDVKVNGKYPDIYYEYDKLPRLTAQERMDGIIAQLSLPEKERPDLIMAYLEEPDHSGHYYGPQAKQTQKVVTTVDSLLNRLYERIQQTPVKGLVNLIVVADHGMTWVAKGNGINIKKYLKDNWITEINGSIPANVYVRAGYADSVCTALRNVPHIHVWKKAEVPAQLHYSENVRIGDVIVSPDLGYMITDDPIAGGGSHGFDPAMSDMHAIFRAIGPDFKHVTLPHFPNVDFYGLLCHLLGIKPAPNDGSMKDISPMLQ